MLRLKSKLNVFAVTDYSNTLGSMQHFKGTLRRRLSHGYFSFIAKYTSN